MKHGHGQKSSNDNNNHRRLITELLIILEEIKSTICSLKNPLKSYKQGKFLRNFWQTFHFILDPEETSWINKQVIC